MLRYLLFFLIIILPPILSAGENLFEDLLIVDCINRRLAETLPVYYNNYLQGGYVNMPSARMGKEGEVATGWSHIPPYQTWNARVQVIDPLEVTFNYRVFKGIPDPVLGCMGFGDYSDKGANLKIAILRAEDSCYKLPSIAVGFDDFIGTRSFKARYLVATQVFLNHGLEATIGIGEWRIRGFFGGVSWMPFHRSCNELLQGLNFAMEYDATPYSSPRREPHPEGRQQRSSFNWGIKYRFRDLIDLSVSYVRGLEWACSASACYNFGATKGFLPKIDDPLPYQAPVNTEPIGPLRSEYAMTHELTSAFWGQGFEIQRIDMYYDRCNNKTLRLSVYNLCYSSEREVRKRFDHLLACLIPEDIDKVVVVLESEGFPIQQYNYNMECVRQFAAEQISSYVLNMVSPETEVFTIYDWEKQLLYKRHRPLWQLRLRPDLHTLFGSSQGKFKYALGAAGGIEGFINDCYYYSIGLGYLFFSDMDNISDCDRLNPSQIINVRSDFTNYLKQRGLVVTEMYLQRNFNLGSGWFSRYAFGYFEREYGGGAVELLYYPVHSCWAAGVEAAVFGKRTVQGLGFTNKVRQMVGFTPTYHHFIGSQFFFNTYYDWQVAQLEFKIKVGKFLANDYGARFEFSRYFDSGLRLSFWYTLTGARDIVNGSVYYDKGVSFSMPLDIFYTCSTRDRWGYGMSAWLRDVGVTACTGKELYNLISEQRQ